MKIMNQKVDHRKFGRGTIFALKGNKIYVSFGKIYGDMQLPYPDVFKSDMKMENADLQEAIMEEIG